MMKSAAFAASITTGSLGKSAVARDAPAQRRDGTHGLWLKLSERESGSRNALAVNTIACRHQRSREPGPTCCACQQAGRALKSSAASPSSRLSYQGHSLASVSHMQLAVHCASQGPPAAHASRLAEQRRALPAAFFTTFLKRLPHAMGSSAGRFSSTGSCAHDERPSILSIFLNSHMHLNCQYSAALDSRFSEGCMLEGDGFTGF